MLAILNAGFGEMLGNVWLEKIHKLGFAGIRTDILPTTRFNVVKELGEFGKLSPIFLFGGGYMSGWTPELFEEQVISVSRQIVDNNYFLNRPIFYEIGNEPDIAVREWRENPSKLNDVYWEAHQTAKSINNKIEVITGGIANLSQNGLDWLDRFMSEEIPTSAIVGFHRYPNGSTVEKPHKGFQSREHEWNRLRALSGGRKLFCTETGLSQGPHNEAMGFPLCWMNRKVWLSEESQAEAIEKEWNFYKRRDVLGMVWYQHRDSDKGGILDHYGIYDSQDQEKASCETIRKILL